MEFPKIEVISNTMMNIDKGAIELFKNNSDHAMIKVEFKNFIIYSWNILNGDDKPALSFTMNVFTENDKNNISMDGFYFGDNKKYVIEDLKLSLTEFYFNNNSKRIEKIANRLKTFPSNEIKPVIFMFQELSLKSANILIKNFCKFDEQIKIPDNIEPGYNYDSVDYTICISLQDQVTFKDKEQAKDELRITLIPKNIKVNKCKSMKSFNTNQSNKLLKGYKSQLITEITFNNKNYTLVNLHLNYMSTGEEFCNFICPLTNKPNLIIVGDFNNNIKLRLENIITNKLPEFKFNFMEPDTNTFISLMPPIVDNENEQSKILDQVLYKLDNDEILPNNVFSDEQNKDFESDKNNYVDNKKYYSLYLKYKNKYLSLKNKKY